MPTGSLGVRVMMNEPWTSRIPAQWTRIGTCFLRSGGEYAGVEEGLNGYVG